MHCPACRTVNLDRTKLEEYLSAHTCEDCSGHWISSYDYWHWLEWHLAVNEDDRPIPVEGVHLELDVADNRRALFCPDCHHLMRKAPVGKGLQFYLDRCSHCGGVWFDQDEWLVLRQRNLHDKVHFIFSEPWQAEIRHQKFKDVLEQTYRATLGDDLYAETMRIKDWLEQHPNKHYILSLLNQEVLTDLQRPTPEGHIKAVKYHSHTEEIEVTHFPETQVA